MRSTVCILLVFLLLAVAVDAQVIPTTVVRSIPHGQRYSQGLAWDAVSETLWVADSGSTTVEELDPYTATRVKTFTAPQTPVRGLAFDAVKNQLWMSTWKSPPTPSVFVLDGATGMVISTLLSPFTGGKSHGLAWDGQTIWLGQEGGNIHKMDVKNWPSNTTLIIPRAGSYEPRDIAWDTRSGSLWVSYQSPPLVKNQNATTGAVIGQFTPPNQFQQGCTWDGWHLWVTGSSNPQTISQIDVSAPFFKLIGSIKGGVWIQFDVSGLPASEAGNVLVVGMSGSGTFPPIIIQGKKIPLTFDNFTVLGLQLMQFFSAPVDASGNAKTQAFQVPAGLPAGIALWFAGATFNTSGIVSVTEPLKFVSQ